MRGFSAKNNGGEKTYLCTSVKSQGGNQYSMQCVEEPMAKLQVQGGCNDSGCDYGDVEYAGTHYRGYGPDLLPGPGSKCPMYTADACEVGTTTTTVLNIGTPSMKYYHVFDLHDGSHLEFKTQIGIGVLVPVDQAFVNSYSRYAAYLNNPNYALLMFNSEQNKGDTPYTVDWIGTKKFKNANRVEFRCQYFGRVINPALPLTLANFEGTECVGCGWFIGKR